MSLAFGFFFANSDKSETLSMNIYYFAPLHSTKYIL